LILNGGISLAPISSRLDIYSKLRTAGFLEGELKYQLMGEPRSHAKQGNFSFSVTAGGGGSSSSGTDVGSILTDASEANYSTNTAAMDFGAIMGYRLDDTLLVYWGGSWTRITYSTRAGYVGLEAGFSFGTQEEKKSAALAEHASAN
jgi:hypothetical protein